MTHINASSHISRTIIHQDFVLFVPANSTDIAVRAIELQKIYYIFAGAGLTLLLEYLRKLHFSFREKRMA